MANEEQLKILRSGVEKWNAWRIENHDAEIDLAGAKLNGAKLNGVDLSKANLSWADLSKADLSWADLNGADLSGVVLSGANLFEADLSGAYLRWAVLNEADLSKANLSKANLSRAKLYGANFSGANLFRADLRNAILFRTKFTSKKQLNELKTDLTEEQLAGAIFEDEEEFARKHKEERKKNLPAKVRPAIKITLGGDDGFWNSLDLVMLLTNVQTTYNRLLYLQKTRETDEDKLYEVLNGPCYPDIEEDLEILLISKQSPLEVIFTTLADSVPPNPMTVILGMVAAAASFKMVCEGIAKIINARNSSKQTGNSCTDVAVYNRSQSSTIHTPVPPDANDRIDFSQVERRISPRSKIVCDNQDELEALAYQPMVRAIGKLQTRFDEFEMELVNYKTGKKND